MPDEPADRPYPECVLQMHDLIGQTADRTAERIGEILEPLIERVERVEMRIVGNGKPGLSEQVHVLQLQHDDMREKHVDSVKLRRQIWLIVAGHAAAIVGAIIWAATWVTKVEHYMAEHQ